MDYDLTLCQKMHLHLVLDHVLNNLWKIRKKKEKKKIRRWQNLKNKRRSKKYKFRKTKSVVIIIKLQCDLYTIRNLTSYIN